MRATLRGNFFAWARGGFVALFAVVMSVVVLQNGSAGATPGSLTISGYAVATSSVGTAIVAGDRFDWSVTLDLNQASTSSTSSYGNTFNNSITSATVTRAIANSGTWNPDGVVWTIAPVFNFFANANGNNLTIQLKSPSVPSINGVAFNDLVISFGWSSANLDAIWAPGSTTLGAWFGTLNPPLWSATYSFEIRNTSYSSATFTNQTTATAPTTTTSTTTTSTTTTTTISPAPSTTTTLVSGNQSVTTVPTSATLTTSSPATQPEGAASASGGGLPTTGGEANGLLLSVVFLMVGFAMFRVRSSTTGRD
ncbi:MAG: hypothetical protein ACKOD2_00740 [Ilumatobacteraceae bacterium]